MNTSQLVDVDEWLDLQDEIEVIVKSREYNCPNCGNFEVNHYTESLNKNCTMCGLPVKYLKTLRVCGRRKNGNWIYLQNDLGN